MVEPTLKDVLDAISRMQGDVAKLDSTIDRKVADLRRDMVTTQDVAVLRREQASIGALGELRRELVTTLDALETEMRARFDRVGKHLA